VTSQLELSGSWQKAFWKSCEPSQPLCTTLSTVQGALFVRQDKPSSVLCASHVWLITWCLAALNVLEAGANSRRAVFPAPSIITSTILGAVFASEASKSLARTVSHASWTELSAVAMFVIVDFKNWDVAVSRASQTASGAVATSAHAVTAKSVRGASHAVRIM